MNLPFVPDQPQDQQVQTEDPKNVPITECHKFFPHTLTFLNESSSDEQLRLFSADSSESYISALDLWR